MTDENVLYTTLAISATISTGIIVAIWIGPWWVVPFLITNMIISSTVKGMKEYIESNKWRRK